MSEYNFKINNIKNPFLESLFRSPPSEDTRFELAFRVKVDIIDDRKVAVILGAQVYSSDSNGEVPKVRVTAEVLGQFVMDTDLPKIKKTEDLKCLPNMLAVLMPYVREKLTYCFSGNDLSYFMPPINTKTLLNENLENPGFQINDHRNTT